LRVLYSYTDICGTELRHQGRYKYRSGVQKSQHQQQKRHWKSKDEIH
jgi:hypothetical protein